MQKLTMPILGALTALLFAAGIVFADEGPVRYVETRVYPARWFLTWFENGRQVYVPDGIAPRRSGHSGTFGKGEVVVASVIILDDQEQIAFNCTTLSAPSSGRWENGGSVNPFPDEPSFPSPECVFQSPAGQPSAGQAPQPAQPTTPGICGSAGQESWGPAIIEAPIGGKPSVVKLDTGHKFVLGSVGQCWVLPGQQALNDRFPGHSQEFIQRTGGHVLFNPSSTGAQAPAPTATPTPVAGICRIGGESVGPAILEGTILDGRATVVKLNTGSRYTLDSGGCFELPSQEELGRVYPNHKAVFFRKYTDAREIIR